MASPRRVSRTDKRLAMAGYPGGMRTIDFLGLKILLAAVGAIAGFVLFGVLGDMPADRPHHRQRRSRAWSTWVSSSG